PQVTMGLICLAGGRVTNDRLWHDAYEQRRDEETLPPTDFPVNFEVNHELGRDWKEYIHHPLLLREIAINQIPALFLVGALDIRPSWAVEQVARLMPNGQYISIANAPHLLWESRADAVRGYLHDYLEQLPIFYGDV